MESWEKICLQWNEFQANLQSSSREFRKCDDYSDVTLVCGDNQQIEAHRIILSSTSVFFSDILKRNPHSHPLIYMRGISFHDLSSILDFIYKGEAEVVKDNLETFLLIAGELGLKGISKQAVNDTNPGQEMEAISDSSKPLWSTALEGLDENVVDKREEFAADDLSCDQCGKTLGTKASLKTHKYNHIKKDSLPLGVEQSKKDGNLLSVTSENRVVQDFSELDAKIDDLTEKVGGKWKCRQCGKEDNLRFHLRRHAETHIEGYSHYCDNCGRMFNTRVALKAHMINKHPQEKSVKPYNCDICYKSSSSEEGLKIHKYRSHCNQPIKEDSSDAI